MKKFTLSALALVAAAVAAPAFAQSSVTLYGRLNTTVENQKVNGGLSKWVVANNSSRLGFKGVEDIGGGLKASFNLEHGFQSDTGTQNLLSDGKPAAFWGREAWVQLAGSFGAVRLGNFTPESYFATADYISMHNHDTGSSSDELYDFSTYRSKNKVGYFTPSMGGLSASLSMSAGEGNSGEKRLIDTAVNYVAGPFHAGFGYAKHGDVNQWALRGLYEMGAFTFGAYYQIAENGYAKKYKNGRLAAMYSMGASEFHLNYGRATDGDQYTLGYNYNLSKRTKVYAYYTDRDTARGTARSGEFSSLAMGVRHNF
ncbi:putative porin [Inhella inkyongensis]|uniref:Putative porin n=1 Tax=Inhella inkyongensis TaxID=392593 RepID=A0A840SCN9_9BURK|nr:porin [Inhella inkyongensis]MBB5206211.1 putative porin [Inhella inkyongensis]